MADSQFDVTEQLNFSTRLMYISKQFIDQMGKVWWSRGFIAQLLNVRLEVQILCLEPTFTQALL